MFRSFTEPCSSGVPQCFSRTYAISNPLPSESAAAEISPDHPINVSGYHTLRGFVSAVKRGCSPSGSGAGEANILLRLVSFLEETQRRTWLNMRAVLSKYTALPLNDCFCLISPDFDAQCFACRLREYALANASRLCYREPRTQKRVRERFS